MRCTPCSKSYGRLRAAVVVCLPIVHLCYVDESGNDQLLDRRDAPPVLVIAGLIVPQARLKDAMWRFLDIKKTFNRSLQSAPLSDLIKTEIKGADLRADVRSGVHKRSRRAIGLLDRVMDLLEADNASLVGQIWVKQDSAGVPPNYYAASIGRIAVEFESLLAAGQSEGVMILDARTKSKNVPNVHGTTTQKFKTGGDPLPHLVESPVFGHSDAHVALQVADIVASALLFPLACLAYCDGLKNNVHPHPNYEKIRSRYAERLRKLEYRYSAADGSRKGGIVVRDNRGKRSSLALYGGPTATKVVNLAAVRRGLRPRPKPPAAI